LNIQGPASVTALLDVLEEIALGVVRVAATHHNRLVIVEALDALTGEPVVLEVFSIDVRSTPGESERTLMKTYLPSRLTQRKV
jgi:hypothetical protein